MFNLIFNVEYEFYCLYFKPGALSFKQSVLFQLKIFINFFAIFLLLSIPAAVFCITSNY